MSFNFLNFLMTFNKVILRPISLADLKEMFALTSIDPEMWIYFTADLSNKIDLLQWIETAVNDTKRLALTVVDISTNKIIGSTSVGNVSERDQRAEIGWTWVGKPFQGKGYNSHVKLTLFKYLFENCNMQRVEIKTDALNKYARNAVAKIGMVEEGILRSHTQLIRNRRRDTIFYGLLSNEWEEVKKKNKNLL